jgi:DNA invertase Pin-like site-specific DNA recombinase
MSNIPEARKLLEQALRGEEDTVTAIQSALLLLDRRRPTFVSPREIRPLTEEQKVEARRLRATGMPVNTIARKLGTNHGRISEACSQ